MNDRHLSGDSYPTGTADELGHPSYGTYGSPDSYGYPPQHAAGYGQDPYGTGNAAGSGSAGYGQDPYGQAAAYDSGHYDTTSWDNTPAHGTPRYQAPHSADWDSGAYPTVSGPDTGQHAVYDTAAGHAGQTGHVGYTGQDAWGAQTQPGTEWDAATGTRDSGGWATADWDTGGWDARAWDTGQQQTTEWDSGAYPLAPTATAVIPAQAGPVEWENTGPEETGDWHSGGYPAAHDAGSPQETDTETTAGQRPVPAGPYDEPDPGTGEDTWDGLDGRTERDAYDGPNGHDRPNGHDGRSAHDGHDGHDEREAQEGYEAATERDDDLPAAFAAPRRGRRRPKPRRSALLTVAAPSLCVLGVTAVAASAIVQPDDSSQSEDDLPLAAPPDAGEVRALAANQQFDTQLEGLTAAADDYADRASRTQGRMDLAEKKAEEKKRAEEEAARKEAERPKFFMPVEQRGLSAVYGQAGVNWMSVHTGIDFPVRYGTPVRAATDGTIRTQWHVSYGNLLILTAPDGTETWYAHLSSTVYQSGYVQAGTVVAYSGNSGNSMGPHLHFEVRPGGGSSIDPAAWLRAKGLSPT